MGNLPQVVSREEWLAARKKLLAEEKELTRARDRVNADRRRLPMVRVDKPYTFEGPNGKVGLLDLFEGRLQLVMHHFMWLFDIDPDGNEIPRDDTCSSCSSAGRRPWRGGPDAGRPGRTLAAPALGRSQDGYRWGRVVSHALLTSMIGLLCWVLVVLAARLLGADRSWWVPPVAVLVAAVGLLMLRGLVGQL